MIKLDFRSVVDTPGFRRFLRFAVVGGGSGLVYVLVVKVLVSWYSMDAPTASAIAYALAIPVNFLGQRLFAFRARGNPYREAVKFLVVHGLNLYLSYQLMQLATGYFEWPLWVGIALCIVAAPLVTFVLLSWFVFVEREADKSLAN